MGTLRYARNIVGAALKIDQEAFANGVGTFARSLLEIPLNGRFSRFTSKVGVDAMTEGRGTVAFEVYGDGKKLWASPIMSGLDAPREIDVNVAGVNRLRLVVTDDDLVRANTALERNVQQVRAVLAAQGLDATGTEVSLQEFSVQDARTVGGSRGPPRPPAPPPRSP